MSRVCVLTLVCALAVVAVTAPADASRKPRCGAGEELTSTGYVRVFSAPDDVFWACWKRTRRVTFLGQTESETGVGQIVIAGHYVAVEHFVQDRSGDQSFTIEVLSAATGRSFTRTDFREGITRRIVLGRKGYLAWTRESGRDEVHVEALAGGTTRVLDSSGRIRPFSLALGGSYLYWMNGDDPRAVRVR